MFDVTGFDIGSGDFEGGIDVAIEADRIQGGIAFDFGINAAKLIHLRFDAQFGEFLDQLFA